MYDGVAIDRVICFVFINNNIKRATAYISPGYTIKATRRYKYDGRNKTIEMCLTIGRPNYREKEFIKKCIKAGEPFPVKRIQIEYER